MCTTTTTTTTSKSVSGYPQTTQSKQKLCDKTLKQMDNHIENATTTSNGIIITTTSKTVCN